MFIRRKSFGTDLLSPNDDDGDDDDDDDGESNFDRRTNNVDPRCINVDTSIK